MLFFQFQAMSLAGELIMRITPKRSEYEFFFWGSKVFRIQFGTFLYPWKLATTFLKEINCQTLFNTF